MRCVVHTKAREASNGFAEILVRQCGDWAMRDIRTDLQERARLIEDKISAAYAQFEKMIEQLQTKREGRV